MTKKHDLQDGVQRAEAIVRYYRDIKRTFHQRMKPLMAELAEVQGRIDSLQRAYDNADTIIAQAEGLVRQRKHNLKHADVYLKAERLRRQLAKLDEELADRGVHNVDGSYIPTE